MRKFCGLFLMICLEAVAAIAANQPPVAAIAANRPPVDAASEMKLVQDVQRSSFEEFNKRVGWTKNFAELGLLQPRLVEDGLTNPNDILLSICTDHTLSLDTRTAACASVREIYIDTATTIDRIMELYENPAEAEIHEALMLPLADYIKQDTELARQVLQHAALPGKALPYLKVMARLGHLGGPRLEYVQKYLLDQDPDIAIAAARVWASAVPNVPENYLDLTHAALGQQKTAAARLFLVSRLGELHNLKLASFLTALSVYDPDPEVRAQARRGAWISRGWLDPKLIGSSNEVQEAFKHPLRAHLRNLYASLRTDCDRWLMTRSTGNDSSD